MERDTENGLDLGDCKHNATYVPEPFSMEGLVSERPHFVLTLVSTDGDESLQDGMRAVDEEETESPSLCVYAGRSHASWSSCAMSSLQRCETTWAARSQVLVTTCSVGRRTVRKRRKGMATRQSDHA